MLCHRQYTLDRDHRPALNCLRALSALIIVVYHFRYYSDVPVIERFPWLAYGNLGVDFFFVLSGLIISHVYYDSFAAGRGSFRHFLFLRVSRLMPVHVLVMGLMLAASCIAGLWPTSGEIFDWLTLALMVRQLLLPDHYVWNTASWSVSAEMFAYAAVFPAIVAITRRMQPANASTLLLVGGTAALLFLIARFGIINWGSGYGPLVRVTAGFMIGSGLYLRFVGTARHPEADRLLIAGILVVCISATLIRTQLAVFLGVVMMIVGTYLSSGPLARFMSRPLPYYLGEISFSFYLVHIPILKGGGFIMARLGMERGVAFCLVTLVLTLLAAIVLYELVEVPARHRLRAWWERRWSREGTTTGAPAQVG